MSETIPVRMASTILLLRDRPAFEVLMVRRQQMIDFLSGAMVFPGGKVERHDLDPGWSEVLRGWDDVEPDQRGPRVAAIRETFEETGILIGAEDFAPGPETLAERVAIEAGQKSFLDYVRARGVTPDLSQLTLFARWVSPPVVPKRFDTFFYLATAPEGQDAVADGRETEAPEWIAPGAALSMAAAGERVMVFPTRMNLGLLARSSTMAEAVAAALGRPPQTIQPSIVTRDGGRFLSLAADTVYGEVIEPLPF